MRLNRRIVQVLFLLALAFAEVACASAGGSGEGRVRRRADQLTVEEINSVDVGNLYEVVRRLRPRWLASRGAGSVGGGEATVMVYQGQTRMGDISVLRTLPLSLAQSMRYLDRSSAQAQLSGPWSPEMNGAIVIETAAQDP